MKKLFVADEWKVIEEGLHPEDNRLAESIMSLGNGQMGMRGNFEETYSGDTHQGSYVAGVYIPDKTRVGWWKNGYPDYFAKVLNSINYIGIRVFIDGEELDLAKAEVRNFRRELNMKHGYLFRSFTAVDSKGRETEVEVIRFISIVDQEATVISYKVTPVNYSATLTFVPYLDGDVRNEDSNYDEDFWLPVSHDITRCAGTLTMRTHENKFNVPQFDVAASMKIRVIGGEVINVNNIANEEYVANEIEVDALKSQPVTLVKYVGVTSSRNYELDEVAKAAEKVACAAAEKGFMAMFEEQQAAWEARWMDADVTIGGDTEAQQGIRFNLFQLFSTYFGEDPRLNIGPKGFTGEKYGGSTYWDTEAYCLPVYLSTADSNVSRNLLVYRHNHLEKAKENAAKLGLGGALYPMVTMNGEECHNEWEITFEEIHRNGAIAYAIYNYVNYTGDKSYLGEYGFDVLVEISRFWASRVHYNAKKDVYMMHGVTGPNEYENNVNNNWYTNRIAAWTLEYTREARDYLASAEADRYAELVAALGLTDEELAKWAEIEEKMYYPIDEETGLILQQDGFLDKDLKPVSDLDSADLPLNQKWSWDRILRSCFIKQADVLQGMYFLHDQFTAEQKKQHFDFYEPMTVHESSLSPCIYSIIAGEIGYEDKAYELYLRTARLDLDNYNNDTEDGLHITSMAGSWLSIVQGFAGMRVADGALSFAPFIPKAWNGYSFKIVIRGHHIKVNVTVDGVKVSQEGGSDFAVKIYDETVTIPADGEVTVELRGLVQQ
ncbi:glycoside hydrolase family 65 protein [Bacillus sp. HMF5848]|uniref:glycoside hydrolase family 65 protein n=1 Tax=Bacillus sp. HMF5848 TaxID=2495421 RepID=UPI000F79A7F6|nr:glycoside hydrolase family 65 protein [Bacillus sp. HMF5848]RSK26402.1 glycoside hydrolase family 65 protein [Bacillus sp. HMF5848]